LPTDVRNREIHCGTVANKIADGSRRSLAAGMSCCTIDTRRCSSGISQADSIGFAKCPRMEFGNLTPQRDAPDDDGDGPAQSCRLRIEVEGELALVYKHDVMFSNSRCENRERNCPARSEAVAGFSFRRLC
jgi:hypothetical protein